MGRTDTGTPARTPDAEGHLERDGVRIWWESYGTGEPVVLLLPALDDRALPPVEGSRSPIWRATRGS